MPPKSAPPSWLDDLDIELDALDASHLRRRRAVVRRLEGAWLEVDGERLLGFCSNDYLGLTGSPELVEAACEGARLHGVGAGASPLVSGHSTANAALEQDLAAFVGLERALYFYAGYAANSSIIPALVGRGDALFSDALNHACLIDGARLSGATIHRHGHGDLTQLAHALVHSTARRKLIITDAVFSMDGDIADIPALLRLCEAHDAVLLLDDAHGFGVLGEAGRGTLAHFGLTAAHASRRVLYMATLGKALGVAGAFVAGHDALVEWLLQKTRGYIFATAAPPMLAHTLRASLRCVARDEWRRERLQQLQRLLQQRLQPALAGTGWRLLDSTTPIQPLLVGSNAAALALMAGLRAMGLWVPAIRPPTVPAGTARLRIALSSAHDASDVDRLVDALIHLSSQHRNAPESTA